MMIHIMMLSPLSYTPPMTFAMHMMPVMRMMSSDTRFSQMLVNPSLYVFKSFLQIRQKHQNLQHCKQNPPTQQKHCIFLFSHEIYNPAKQRTNSSNKGDTSLQHVPMSHNKHYRQQSIERITPQQIVIVVYQRMRRKY